MWKEDYWQFICCLGQGDLKLAARKTVTSERGAENLMECLDVCAQYEGALEEYEETGKKGQPPSKPSLMVAYQVDTPDEYLVDTIRRIRARWGFWPFSGDFKLMGVIVSGD